ncbi:DNA-binding response regulator [Dictyobacter alpinus]|uniref:DNA-binding response regulator n=1 Tax=Dictyobacter alpinus TaxID=2014873 RepID=A0A402BB55_9CHLR|nr:response regulator transcription factor [Dictyobacter alpinus]GCE28536.1 DNA-binding response regulator [Dictyobacter alpinus]
MTQNVVYKILIAESREVIRLGLRSVFEQDSRITDIYEAANFEELKSHMLSYTINFAIIHQSFLAESKQLPLSGKFILLTNTPDITTLLEAYRRQARGYVSENVTADLLRIALQAQKGAFLLDPLFVPWMLEYLSNNMQCVDALNALSPREREIFQLLQEGCDRRNIAKQLHISEATLKTHVKNIARKHEKNGAIKAGAEKSAGMKNRISSSIIPV